MSVCSAQHAAAQAQVAPLTQPAAPRGAGATRQRRRRGVYIVKLKDPGAATYQGERAGYAATQPGPGQRMHAHRRPSKATCNISSKRTIALLGRGRRGRRQALRLSLRAERLRREAHRRRKRRCSPSGSEVERIWPDTDQHTQTNNSAIFLGLEDQQGGLRADLNLRGENVVVGIIDSGVAPHHPSLLDTEERDSADLPRAVGHRPRGSG